MVDFMKKVGIVIALFLLCSGAFATPPVYGPLQAQNNLDDVDNSATSLANLGGAPLASPTFTGIVTIPSGSILNTPTSINLTNATNVPYSSLPSLSANQLLGSLTATTPSGQSVPSCSTATDALLWTSGTGFSCNSSINAGTLGGATFASPGSIGSGTASTGSFTTLSASSTVTGIGLIGIQTFCSSGCTSTGGTYTPDSGTQAVIVEVQAPGGGSGGCASTGASQMCVTGGSGAGSKYYEGFITSSFSGVTVTIGSAGSAGSAGNNPGVAGGTTSFGTIISCPGGFASGGGAAQASTLFQANGGGASAASACTISGASLIKSVSGLGGGIGVADGTTGNTQFSGAGASSVLGIGGMPAITGSTTSGTSGTGYGSGASGSVADCISICCIWNSRQTRLS